MVGARRFRPVVGIAVAAFLLVAPVAAARADAGPGDVQIPDITIGPGGKAPLTPADRDFVVRVRLAGLWEMPAGMMAASKGVNPRVRQIGTMIATQHVALDALDRTAAAQLGVSLPNRPTTEQQAWLDEMSA